MKASQCCRMRGTALVVTPVALERRFISNSSESVKARLHNVVQEWRALIATKC